MDKPRVTIVLLIKNNVEILEDLLAAIFAQSVDFPFEVLAVDSGSWDGSLAILKRYKYKLVKKKNSSRFARTIKADSSRFARTIKADSSLRQPADRTINLRIHQIAPIEFGFGRTGNLAARLARGEIVVFLSTRVITADRDWLSSLIGSLSPFTRIASGTVAVFGKVNPGPKLAFSEAFRLKTFYPRASRILTKKAFPGSFSILFSDLNCAILTCVLRKFPFPEDIIGGEDQVWARTILENGMSIAYNPHAGVIFLKGHTFSEIFRHYFNKGDTFAKGVSVSGFTVFWSWVRFLLHEIIYLIKKQNLKAVFKETFFELGRLLGFFLGQRADQLPEGLRDRFLLPRR